MIKFLKSLLGGTDTGGDAQPESAVEYKGYRITPCPHNRNGGWSTQAVIEKEIDGEIKTHHFIRADSTSGKDGAIELILSKCRMTIDQLGDRIFD